jgi:hypothetical protein
MVHATRGRTRWMSSDVTSCLLIYCAVEVKFSRKLKLLRASLFVCLWMFVFIWKVADSLALVRYRISGTGQWCVIQAG